MPRFWEIDYCRGIAVFMMLLFHTAFDLAYFGIFPIEVRSGPWKILAVCTASLFLLLVGISLTLSGARAMGTLDRKGFILKYVRRGAWIMALGFLITIVTLIVVPGGPILFGILHLIGFSIVLAPLYLRYRWANLCAGALLILAGWSIMGLTGPSWLIWLGIHPAGFASLDYTPVLPWFGVVLFGVFLGHSLYPGGERRFRVPAGGGPGQKLVTLAGRHSLAIYFAHQPIILLMIALIFPVPLVPPG